MAIADSRLGWTYEPVGSGSINRHGRQYSDSVQSNSVDEECVIEAVNLSLECSTTKHKNKKQIKTKQKINTFGKFKHKLKIAYWNACSVGNGKDEQLLDLADRQQLDIIGVSETKLTEDSDTELYSANGKWTWFRGPCVTGNRETAKGGLAFAVRSVLASRVELVKQRMNAMWIRIRHSSKHKNKKAGDNADSMQLCSDPFSVTSCGAVAQYTYIGSVYIPCSGERVNAVRQQELADLAAEVGQYHLIGETVIIGGDFNGRLACNGDDTTNSYGRQVLEFAQSAGLDIVSMDSNRTFGKYHRTIHQRDCFSTIDYGMETSSATGSAGSSSSTGEVNEDVDDTKEDVTGLAGKADVP